METQKYIYKNRSQAFLEGARTEAGKEAGSQTFVEGALAGTGADKSN